MVVVIVELMGIHLHLITGIPHPGIFTLSSSIKFAKWI